MRLFALEIATEVGFVGCFVFRETQIAVDAVYFHRRKRVV